VLNQQTGYSSLVRGHELVSAGRVLREGIAPRCSDYDGLDVKRGEGTALMMRVELAVQLHYPAPDRDGRSPDRPMRGKVQKAERPNSHGLANSGR